ncbi:hypothetical protein C8J57DRAFT_1599938, partial [Mycena rebaudengoi]
RKYRKRGQRPYFAQEVERDAAAKIRHTISGLRCPSARARAGRALGHVAVAVAVVPALHAALGQWARGVHTGARGGLARGVAAAALEGGGPVCDLVRGGRVGGVGVHAAGHEAPPLQGHYCCPGNCGSRGTTGQRSGGVKAPHQLGIINSEEEGVGLGMSSNGMVVWRKNSHASGHVDH